MRVRNKAKIVLAVLLLASVGVVAWRILHPEPTYSGKSVNEWLRQKADNSGDLRQATNALHQIGPRAVPFIVRKLIRDNSGLVRLYRRTWPQLPRVFTKILPQPREPLSEVVAVNAFHDIGPAAIPSLTALLTNKNPLVRSSAAWALQSFQRSGEGDAVVIAKLIPTLRDADARVRAASARALGEFGPKAVQAVAPLIARLKDDEKGADKSSLVFVRAAAARSLGRIGPSAKKAVPMLTALSNDAHFYTRMEAHIALWRIQRSVSEALPQLTADLPLVDEQSKWEIFEALAEMGSGAKDAVPAITPDLHSANPEVRQRAAEALWRIDPAQAPVIVEAISEPITDPDATTGNFFSVTEGAKLLGQMGTAAQSATPLLVKLLKHSYGPARTAAAEALKRIDPGAAEAEMGQQNGAFGQPNGAANRSQPVGAQTNRTSSAAGSRR